MPRNDEPSARIETMKSVATIAAADSENTYVDSFPKPPFDKALSIGGPATTNPFNPKNFPTTNNSSVPGRHIQDDDVHNFLKKELSVQKLHDIFVHLWWAGRPQTARALHAQRMMKREIVVTENVALHLIWFDTTIFMKPLPSWLLNWKFFDNNLCDGDGSGGGDGGGGDGEDGEKLKWERKELHQAANGFLKTYTKLVQHPSDFRIARELGLFPDEIQDWETWSKLSASLRFHLETAPIANRYRYGELRLRRLNHINRLFRGGHYHSLHLQYDQFFANNFAWPLLFLVYLSVILSSMQVVLSTPKSTEMISDVFYWFSVVALVFVLAVIVIQLFLFAALFLYHLVCTIVNLERLGIDWVLGGPARQRFLESKKKEHSS